MNSFPKTMQKQTRNKKIMRQLVFLTGNSLIIYALFEVYNK
jgi:hypothetical protein